VVALSEQPNLSGRCWLLFFARYRKAAQIKRLVVAWGAESKTWFLFDLLNKYSLAEIKQQQR